MMSAAEEMDPINLPSLSIVSPPTDSGERQLASAQLAGRDFIAWLSTQPRDEAWDQFLESTPLGHFQQSAAWAEVKENEGWKVLRVVVREKSDNRIHAGFQILMKKKGMVAVAYISKGPVIPVNEFQSVMRRFVSDQVVTCVQRHRIDALIAQPPDDDAATGPGLSQLGFEALGLSMVVESTLVVDLLANEKGWRRDLRKTTGNQVRKSVKRGVTTRVATAEDLPVFFDLMRETCRRQKTSPNPSSLEAVQRLWSSFQSRGYLRISFAEFESQTLATVLLIKFGQRVTLWKKGWNSKFPNHHPNDLVNHEAMEWSEQVGAQWFDFAAMDPDIARRVIANEPLLPEQMATRYFFLMGFGGSPRLLPPAQIYLRNPILRRMFPLLRPLLVAFEQWKEKRAQRRK